MPGVRAPHAYCVPWGARRPDKMPGPSVRWPALVNIAPRQFHEEAKTFSCAGLESSRARSITLMRTGTRGMASLDASPVVAEGAAAAGAAAGAADGAAAVASDAAAAAAA